MKRTDNLCITSSFVWVRKVAGHWAAIWPVMASMIPLAAPVTVYAGPPAKITSGQFDSSATSLAVIPHDPNAIGVATNQVVSGAIGSHLPGPFTGTNLNHLLDADTFYDNGFTGSSAVIANIGAGHFWSGHETLMHANQMTTHPSALGEIDRHATWIGTVLGGRPGGPQPGEYQRGLAFDAELFSGAISSQWNRRRYSLNFNFFFSSFVDTYRLAFSTGITGEDQRRPADVINSSFGGDDFSGTGTMAVGLDGLVSQNSRTLFTASANNLGVGPNSVLSPATGYNNMSVAALRSDPTFDTPSSFSSGGPNDYADPVNGTIPAVRQVVDIAAPGQQIGAAYYGGQTGGNGTTDNNLVPGSGPSGGPNGPAGGPDWYSRSLAGTSFSAPMIAGGAALMYDAAYTTMPANDDARDARVIKAVLMNSADKTVAWDNHQIPNAHGGVMTSQGLDNRVGTGRLNLDRAFDQYLTGTTDVPQTGSGDLGIVQPVGWDFGVVNEDTANDYYFADRLAGGSTFTGTLTWFRDRRLSTLNVSFDDSYDDLDLELWSVHDGVPDELISASFSAYNNSEHFSFEVPKTGDYALRVLWVEEVFDLVNDVNAETYGLAWSAISVPEPSSLVLATLALLGMAPWMRRKEVRWDGDLWVVR